MKTKPSTANPCPMRLFANTARHHSPALSSAVPPRAVLPQRPAPGRYEDETELLRAVQPVHERCGEQDAKRQQPAMALVFNHIMVEGASSRQRNGRLVGTATMGVLRRLFLGSQWDDGIVFNINEMRRLLLDAVVVRSDDQTVP